MSQITNGYRDNGIYIVFHNTLIADLYTLQYQVTSPAICVVNITVS